MADLYNLSGSGRRRREYDHAIVRFSEQIAVNPWDAEAYFNRGNTYRRKRSFTAAILDFNAALEIDPTFAEAWFYKAVCCAVLGHDLEELQAYEQFLACAGEDLEHYLEPITRRIDALNKKRQCYKSIKTVRKRKHRPLRRRKLPATL